MEFQLKYPRLFLLKKAELKAMIVDAIDFLVGKEIGAKEIGAKEIGEVR